MHSPGFPVESEKSIATPRDYAFRSDSDLLPRYRFSDDSVGILFEAFLRGNLQVRMENERDIQAN